MPWSQVRESRRWSGSRSYQLGDRLAGRFGGEVVELVPASQVAGGALDQGDHRGIGDGPR